jgi:Divergent InlB B-repeat domain
MNLVTNLRWAVIATSILSGSALAAAINCPISPAYSVITEGQTLQLTADCTGALASVEWSMADGQPATSLTGVVDVTGHSAHQPISFTTPVGLGGSNQFTFTLSGTPANGADSFAGSSAIVVVKPSSAAIARAQGISDPTTPVDAQCGSANGGSVQAMPSGTAQCASGSSATLAVSAPSSFSWSCVSLTGGAEASCFATRGWTVTANVSGGNGTVSVSPVGGGVAAGGTAIVTAYPSSGYTATMTGCGGSQSGNTYTTGPVNANCTVTATFTNAPVNGACGSASNSTVVTSAPSSNLCSTGTATTVASGTTAYTWGCNGANGGSNTSCSAPRGYTVTVNSGGNGTVSGSPKTVQGGTTTSFSVSPASGYVASTVTGSCGGSVSGSTYNTGSITANCTETVNFAEQSSSTDPGSGSWVPPGTSNRLIADQSGGSIDKYSYVPGCLNGEYPTSSSSSGCAATTQDESGFTFGSGSVLGVRYVSNSPLSTSVKYFRVNSGDGGNLGQVMKVWISTDPLSTYDNTAATCHWTSTTTLYAPTGAGYCSIQPNKLYYLFMQVDAAPPTAGFRYKVDELAADFQ